MRCRPGGAAHPTVRCTMDGFPRPASPMIYNALKLAHVLSIIVWIGGMVFAHFFLRPAAQALEPAQRVTPMHGVLQRFPAPWPSPSSGADQWPGHDWGRRGLGGAFSMPLKWTIMATLGLGDDGHLRLHLLRPAR